MNYNLLYLEQESRKTLYINENSFLLYFIMTFYVSSFVFIGKFPFNVLPLVLGLSLYFIFKFYHFSKPVSYISFSIPLLFLIFFSSLSLIYIFLERGAQAVLSIEFIFFLSLPIMYSMTKNIIERSGIHLICKSIFFFLIYELTLIVGQLTKKVIGIGFNTPAFYSDVSTDRYGAMLSGSFLNSNDLAAVCGMCFVLFLLLRRNFKKIANSGLLICFLIALFTMSRSVIVFMVLSFSIFVFKRSMFKGVLYFFISIFLAFSLYIFLKYKYSNVESIYRIIVRLESIVNIAINGIDGDNSMSLRMASYINYFYKIGDLGLGTGKLRDYSDFVKSLGSKFSLMATNPHSFLIEISYWLGLPGIISFLTFIFTIRKNNFFRYSYVVGSFFLLSMVSSSIISNFIFFIIFFANINIACIDIKIERNLTDVLT